VVRERRALAPRLLLLGCFLLSGATGLVYEVVWSRYLQLVFGSSTDSVAVVLAIYMAGLGAGAAACGRFVDRGANPVRVYAALEAGVAVFALASPPLFAGISWIHASLQGRLDLGPGAATALKALLSMVALGAPTLLMGGTLPALMAALGSERGRSIGRLYAANTVGAAGGAAISGFLLIEALGLWRTLLCAAVANLLIAGLALAVGRRGVAAATPVAAERRRWLHSPAAAYLATGAALSGALAMFHEIAWSRLLTLVLGPSTYAFSAVLIAYLVGIALGAALHARTAARIRGPAALAATQIASAAVMAALLLAFDAIPLLALYARRLPALQGPQFLHVQVLLAALLLVPPAIVAGYTLPLCIASLAGDGRRTGTDVGDLYLFNTGGAILGSALTGFVLIPAIGSEHTVRLGIVLPAAFALAGAHRAATGARRLALAAAGLGAIAVATIAPRWDRSALDSGAGWREPRFRTRLEARAAIRQTPSETLFWEEGRNATVSVRRHPDGTRTLYVSGKADASDRNDMPTQAFLGTLPMLAHPEARRVLIVGLGSGVTAGRVAAFAPLRPDLRIDVVELEEAVVRASEHFADLHGDVLHERGVRLLVMDARGHLAATRERYDLIVSEPSNPWLAGVSTLFSRDHYLAARRRLNPGGVYAQWIQMYSMDAGTLLRLIATFAASFGHVQAWNVGPGDLMLLGAAAPISFSVRDLRAQAERLPWLRADLEAYWRSVRVEDLFGRFLLGDGLVREITASVPIVTDDRNPIEFRAARALYGTHVDHLLRLWDIKLRAGERLPPIRGEPPAEADLWRAAAIACPHAPTGIAAARRALDLRPDDGEARATLVRRLVGERRFDEAERAIPGSGRVEPDLRLALAVARERWTDVEALLAARPDLDASPPPGPALVSVLRARREAGDVEGAWRAAERAVTAITRTRAGGDVDRRDAIPMWTTEIVDLARATHMWRRGAELLEDPRWGKRAEFGRLVARAECLDGAGDARGVLETLDAARRFGPLGAPLLEMRRRALAARGEARAARELAAVLERDAARAAPLWLRTR
jgi:spermidine synthase